MKTFGGKSSAIAACLAVMIVLGGLSAFAGVTETEVIGTNAKSFRIHVQSGTEAGLRVGDQYEIVQLRSGTKAGQYDIVGVAKVAKVGTNSAWLDVSRRHTEV